MDPSVPFRIAFVLMIAGMVAVRATWARRARVLEDGVANPSEGPWTTPIRIAVLPLFTLIVGTWLARPDALPALNLPFPAWLRWAGVALYVPSLGLLAWVHWTLGTNFSHKLRIRADHRLVTEGPYRWVRHPMYTAFLMLAASFALVSAHALLVFLPAGMVLAVVLSRTPREEAMLEERFGDAWRAYRARTGALLPRLW